MNTTAADPYVALGVPRDADRAVIQRAYRSLMRKHHPDMPGGDPARAAAISAAYELLSDEGRRAAYDLDSRRGPVTTQPTGSTGGTRRAGQPSGPRVRAPEAGELRFRALTLLQWLSLALVIVGTVAALVVPAYPVAVAVVAVVVSGVAIVVLHRSWLPFVPHMLAAPAAAVATSIDPVAGWLGTGTWPLVVLAGLCLALVVATTLHTWVRLRKQVNYTTEKRWFFLSGQTPHDFLLACGNAPGWVGVAGPGAFDTLLMNGRNLILLSTARPTYAGETLSMEYGQLLRTRPGSRVGLPDELVDLPMSLPQVPKGFRVRFAVFVPGVAAGTGPLGGVPVIGEADLLSWMSEVPASKLSRQDVLAVADLVADQVAQV